ncbi:MAG: DUF4296 domain-containing protein [Bacteroidia bacterium]|nr:DUF4296 domain-containing protein [Bacteroidia bacterium]
MNKNLIYPILIILLVLNSCGEGRSKSKKGILSEEKMVELLVDTHLADAMLLVDNSRLDEKRNKALFYFPSVLEKHGITKAQMDSSVAWYMRNPAGYARIYEQVIKNLEKRQASEIKIEKTE